MCYVNSYYFVVKVLYASFKQHANKQKLCHIQYAMNQHLFLCPWTSFRTAPSSNLTVVDTQQVVQSRSVLDLSVSVQVELMCLCTCILVP